MSQPPLKAVQHAELPPSYWTDRWAKGEAFWHMNEVNPDLLAHIHSLDAIKSSVPPSRRPRMLVPLCGATVDMVYFIANGWHVVGLDAAEQALRTFVAEHAGQLGRVREEAGGAWLRLTAEHLDLYALDFFGSALTPALIGGLCDAVWDRGSLVAIGVQQREAYVKRLLSLLNKSHGQGTTPAPFNYLLNTFDYNQDSAFTAPPHCVSKEVVDALIGPHAERIEVVGLRDAMERHPDVAGLKKFDVVTFAISVTK